MWCSSFLFWSHFIYYGTSLTFFFLMLLHLVLGTRNSTFYVCCTSRVKFVIICELNLSWALSPNRKFPPFPVLLPEFPWIFVNFLEIYDFFSDFPEFFPFFSLFHKYTLIHGIAPSTPLNLSEFTYISKSSFAPDFWSEYTWNFLSLCIS